VRREHTNGTECPIDVVIEIFVANSIWYADCFVDLINEARWRKIILILALCCTGLVGIATTLNCSYISVPVVEQLKNNISITLNGLPFLYPACWLEIKAGGCCIISLSPTRGRQFAVTTRRRPLYYGQDGRPGFVKREMANTD